MSERYKQLIDFLSSQEATFFSQFNRGLEREALRINENGKLSQQAHPKALGSALSHQFITTDYAEPLLEFITPVENKPEISIAQLKDVQKYTYQHINGEMLWPLSMPCFVGSEDEIKLADYGSSNVGQMKRIYREGLRNRYGSVMQVISGVHFNFSFPQSFWAARAKAGDDNDCGCTQDLISAGYLATIRNLKRHLWLLPYLFGSSPALCSSFIKNTQTNLDFETVGKGTAYLPYATSLRMSDLGYTNSAQADLNIKYNCLEQYIDGMRHAINLPSDEFAHIGVKVDGKYKQLNSNVLQIENEFYSAIRPKRVANSGETPSNALQSRGIQYMEIRALDVDPFSDVGISVEQIRFLDLLLVWCAMQDSENIDEAEQAILDNNFELAIMQGRKADLMLEQKDKKISLKAWGLEIVEQLNILAEIMDCHSEHKHYADALAMAKTRLCDPEQTPSGRLLKQLIDENIDNGELGMKIAASYKQQSLASDYSVYSHALLSEEAKQSLIRQEAIEKSDDKSLDDFLSHYFLQ